MASSPLVRIAWSSRYHSQFLDERKLLIVFLIGGITRIVENSNFIHFSWARHADGRAMLFPDNALAGNQFIWTV